MRSHILITAAFVASLALAYVWPSTEWAAQNDAERIARDQCRLNGLNCETEARPRKPKTKDFCEGALGSRPSRSHLVSAPQWRI